ncbi:putative beta-lysine N-acetyltransferase [Bacillus infantis]|uniref:putative beta-lysine N-acetyltransferase n=1 Tax=Bacillus infantis TaxID=324767 RepID=UPI002155DBCC|nr:putative beta-lysine N-acetyltransferase [Bacillus infantis]MCR6611621.1 putative beta-lysine N-acetyltransferase [Bacillus infantis]
MEQSSVRMIRQETFSLEVFIDPYNKRIRVDDTLGNHGDALAFAYGLREEIQAEKMIVKARAEEADFYLENGFQAEGKIDGYFLGSDAYFMSKYYKSSRRTNPHWAEEDEVAEKVRRLERTGIDSSLEKPFRLVRFQPEDAPSLAELYKAVFQIYPVPMDDPQYIEKSMESGTLFFGVKYEGKIVSAASAEINSLYRNAELTDCATLPDFRKHGLMKILISKLEEELIRQGIFCAYSIARSLSYGMNAALHQHGYSYRGRLANNCYIFDKLEDMNIWVKNLAMMPKFRH